MKRFSSDYSFNTTTAFLNDMRKFNSIVLIDDDEINNYISASLLKKMDLSPKIKLFKNGKAALDFIKKLDTNSEVYPDLIFLDIHMPIMDGYDFAKEIETIASRREIKIIVLSTSIREEDRERLKQFNIHSFINKPLTEDKLIELFKN